MDEHKNLIENLRNEKMRHENWFDEVDAVENIFDDCNLAASALEDSDKTFVRLQNDLADCINELCQSCDMKPNFCSRCRWRKALRDIREEETQDGQI